MELDRAATVRPATFCHKTLSPEAIIVKCIRNAILECSRIYWIVYTMVHFLKGVFHEIQIVYKQCGWTKYVEVGLKLRQFLTQSVASWIYISNFKFLRYDGKKVASLYEICLLGSPLENVYRCYPKFFGNSSTGKGSQNPTAHEQRILAT